MSSSFKSIRHRILSGFGATALGPLVTVAIQLGPIPFLLHSWGAAKYGDWLLLSAVPNYLTLANLGLGDASGSDMTFRVASGDRTGALETFQSSFALVAAVSLAILLVAAATVWWIPWQNWLHLSSLSNSKAAAIIFTFGVFVITGQQCGVLESGYRCDGNFALGVSSLTILRLLENALACLVGFFSGNLLWMALTFLIVRAIGTLCYGFGLKRKSPWLRLGFEHVRAGVLRRLVKPALGFIALPLGYAISLQGTTIMIGSLLGPSAVAAFSTLRTLTRLNSQALNAVGWSAWPEFSSAFGAGNIPLARQLHRHAFQLGLALSALLVLILWQLGPFVYGLWTRNSINFDANCFHLLLLVTLADSLWFMSSVVPMSTNAHHRLAFAFVAISSFSLILCRALMPAFRLEGVGLGAFAQRFIDDRNCTSNGPSSTARYAGRFRYRTNENSCLAAACWCESAAIIDLHCAPSVAPFHLSLFAFSNPTTSVKGVLNV